MLYTMDRLIKLLNRSEAFIRLCLMRFDIKQTKLKISKKVAYDIQKETMQQILKFNQTRKLGKKRKMNIKSELERLITEANWKLEALPEKYFIDYFEEEFIKKFKNLVKELK